MKQPGVSVIICCYNSAALLPQTLEHLANQQTAGEISWEIIIVNNNSTDNTAEIAENIWQGLNRPIPFRVVHQPEPD
jgi:glycosyltransferase involved in cell wall biosynthesis